MREQIKKTALILLAVLLVATLTSAAASAVSVDTSKYYKIMSLQSGQVLEVKGGSTADHAPVIQNYVSSNKYQEWYLSPVNELSNGVWKWTGHYYIINKNSGKVLDVRDDIAPRALADGATLQQYSYITGQKNQQWRFDALDGAPYYVYDIVSRYSNKVIDDSGFSISSGTIIQQWTWLNGLNQKWVLVPVGTIPVSGPN